MKGKAIIFIIFLVVLADQALKLYVKMHFNIGDYRNIIGDYFQLYFVENKGMAFGWKFHGGDVGKLFLTVFRLGAIIFGSWYLRLIVNNKYHTGFIICIALIFSGALGNLIDSMFYGIIFEESKFDHIAAIFPHKGYAGFLFGNVVDMLYFPKVNITIPTWFPFWNGKKLEFFHIIFNIADLVIFIGVTILLIFQKTFLKQEIDIELQ